MKKWNTCVRHLFCVLSVCAVWPVVSARAQARLGLLSRVEGPQAGTDSVTLASEYPGSEYAWFITAWPGWLHVDPGLNGTTLGFTNVAFTFDANPGSTRTGTITFECDYVVGSDWVVVESIDVKVTQAGAGYEAAGALTTLFSGLTDPLGLAVDGPGNVYVADYSDSGSTKKWVRESNTVVTLANFPHTAGVAVDSTGNVFMVTSRFARDVANGAVHRYDAATQTTSTLYSESSPSYWLGGGIAVDASGSVYFAQQGDYDDAVIEPTHDHLKRWKSGSTANWLEYPKPDLYFCDQAGDLNGLAVDVGGKVYSTRIADKYTVYLYKYWDSGTLTTLGTFFPYNDDWGCTCPFTGLAVDGCGNLYLADEGHRRIRVRKPDGSLSNLINGIDPGGVAVDQDGSVYVSDWMSNTVAELPRAFVDTTPQVVNAGVGHGQLPPVLPPSINLSGPFQPTTDQPWLGVTGVTNGVVSFGFELATTNRVGHINVLGQSIAVMQAGMQAPVLFGEAILPNGRLQFSFSNTVEGATFAVVTSTDATLPLSQWSVAGAPTNVAPGLFQFSTPCDPKDPPRYFRVRTP